MAWPNQPFQRKRYTGRVPHWDAQSGISSGLAHTAKYEERMKTAYSACNHNSAYHDLQCGHRIQTPHAAQECCSNCLKSSYWAPFICPECVVEDVRAKMTLAGLHDDGLDVKLSGNGPSREEQIRAIADGEIKHKLRLGHHICKVMSKFEDPKMQFFNEFLVEEGFEGINEEAPVADEPGKKLKRPGPGARAAPKKRPAGIWEPREVIDLTADDDEIKEIGVKKPQKEAKGGGGGVMGSLAQLMGDTRVGLEVEDEAMKAVREVLEACALEAMSGGGA